MQTHRMLIFNKDVMNLWSEFDDEPLATMAAKNPFQKGISLKDQKNERWLGLTRSNRETSSTFPVSSTILYLSLLCSSLHI